MEAWCGLDVAAAVVAAGVDAEPPMESSGVSMAGHEISAVVDGDEVKAAMLKL